MSKIVDEEIKIHDLVVPAGKPLAIPSKVVMIERSGGDPKHDIVFAVLEDFVDTGAPATQARRDYWKKLTRLQGWDQQKPGTDKSVGWIKPAFEVPCGLVASVGNVAGKSPPEHPVFKRLKNASPECMKAAADVDAAFGDDDCIYSAIIDRRSMLHAEMLDGILRMCMEIHSCTIDNMQIVRIPKAGDCLFKVFWRSAANERFQIFSELKMWEKEIYV